MAGLRWWSLGSWRWRWALARRGLSYSTAIFDRIYRIYLNHAKVIHYRDGFPVYSLTTPAAFSKPAANFLARALYRTIQNRNLPNLMSFAVNDICNAHCPHCSFYEGVDAKDRTVLSLDQARKVVADAQDLGVSVINFVGGEPLLRRDLSDIIASVDKGRSCTVLFTNGWFLQERAVELRRAGLDGVYISLDASTASAHDSCRGVKGLFDRAVAGASAARRLGMSTGVSYCVTPEAYAAGELDDVIEMSRRIGAHEVLVFDALPTGRFQNRQDLVDNNEWVDTMIEKARPYNEAAEYPGIAFFSYMTSHRSAGCSCGTSYFYVSPYGDVMSCDFNHAVFGNVLDAALYQVWDRLSTDPDFRCAKWGGCKIKDATYRQLPTVTPARWSSAIGHIHRAGASGGVDVRV